MAVVERVEADQASESFEAALAAHMDLFYAIALRLTHNAADAQDLLQDACMRAWRFRDRYQPGTYFKAWMVTIIRNTFINDYRKKARRPRSVSWDGLEYAPPPKPDPAMGYVPEAVKSADILECLDDDIKQAVEALPDGHREAVILADLHSLSYKEVAEELDCPLGTVMSRLHRGRRLLREALGHYREASVR